MSHSHTPDPDANGICRVCGVEVTSPITEPGASYPQLGDVLSKAGLEALHPGSRVADSDGDIWQRQMDGSWKLLEHISVSSCSLVRLFPPIRLYEEI